jgi:hypothetical protein
MTKKWLHWLNLVLAGLILVALISALVLTLSRPKELSPNFPVQATPQLPTHGFQQPETSYQKLNEQLLKLKVETPAIQLPNLRPVLMYYGKNGRPDADAEKPLLHFGIANTKDTRMVTTGDFLYLTYDRTAPQNKYNFSPNNQPTPLWIEAAPYNVNQVAIQLFLRGNDGTLVSKPQANAYFLMQEKDYARFGGNPVWEIDKTRIDGTLLVRQKARWYGVDLFLAQHGGDLYPDVGNKQRIDFGEGEDVYSVFVDEGTCLIWKDGRWKVATPGPDTAAYPLLCVRKIDPRLINFELWDVNGRNKILLNLLKTTDAPTPKTLPQNIKFLGARTLSRYLFEVNGERVVLSPHEWLLFKDNRWHLLRDPIEIQRFVERKIVTPLFIFDGVIRRGDRQVLQGTLYNASRTDTTAVEIPLLSGGLATPSAAKAPPKGQPASATTPQRFTPAASPVAAPNGAAVMQSGGRAAVTPPASSAQIEQDDDEDGE